MFTTVYLSVRAELAQPGGGCEPGRVGPACPAGGRLACARPCGRVVHPCLLNIDPSQPEFHVHALHPGFGWHILQQLKHITVGDLSEVGLAERKREGGREVFNGLRSAIPTQAI